MLLIHCVSPKVTQFWKSGLCGCFRLTLTHLSSFHFLSFKNAGGPSHTLSLRRQRSRLAGEISLSFCSFRGGLSLNGSHFCVLCTVRSFGPNLCDPNWSNLLTRGHNNTRMVSFFFSEPWRTSCGSKDQFPSPSTNMKTWRHWTDRPKTRRRSEPPRIITRPSTPRRQTTVGDAAVG